MLEYQRQDCDLTLQEGLDCYYKAFPETTEIFEDNTDSGTLLREFQSLYHLQISQ